MAGEGVPIVGGHTNLRTERGQLAVSVLGRAKLLLTSFDARVGQRLVAAIDLRGRYRQPFANWEAATDAPPNRLRSDLALLPAIAEAGLASACKDISQGGLHRHGCDVGGGFRRATSRTIQRAHRWMVSELCVFIVLWVGVIWRRLVRIVGSDWAGPMTHAEYPS